MQPFLKVLKRNKFSYIIAISLVTTVILVDTVLDFSEKVINNPTLLLFSIAVFYFLIRIAIKEKLWEDYE